MIYFTSDTHYGHKNVIEYCNRPYETKEQMDEALIKNHNSVVKPNDIVYHIGDFAFCKPERAIEILDQLNGQIVLIRGNHDKKMTPEVKGKFMMVRDYYELRVQDKEAPRGSQTIILLHYAMRVWDKSHHGAWQLYGHSHGSLPDDPTLRSIDVGVDCHNYTPISYDEVKAIMARKTPRSVDHHI